MAFPSNLPVPIHYLALHSDTLDTGRRNATPIITGSLTYDTRLGVQSLYVNTNNSIKRITLPTSFTVPCTLSIWCNVDPATPAGNWAVPVAFNIDTTNSSLSVVPGYLSGTKYINISGGYFGSAGNSSDDKTVNDYWKNTILVCTENNTDVYSDGILVNPVAYGIPAGTYTSITIGDCNNVANATNNYGYPSGVLSYIEYIRDVCVFDGALSGQQVNDLYNYFSMGNVAIFPPPPSPLRLLLKASGYTSGAWLDQSPNAYNATLENGTATLNAAGNGFVLDGQTSFTCPNVGLGNAWTVNVWYKQVGPLTGPYHCILSQTYGGSVNMFIGVGAGSTNIAGGFLNNNWQAGGPITLPNEWTNIQVTWDGSHMKTYILGILTSSVQINYPSIDNTQAYTIGRCDWSNPSYMTGELGEVRIYNTPLTQAQVTADFEESLATFINTSAPYNITTSIGVNYFTARWLGGIGATSYTYKLNGSPVTPSTDNGLTSQSATFTGLTPETNYVLAILPNSNNSLSASTSIKTLITPVHQLLLNNSNRDMTDMVDAPRLSATVALEIPPH